MSQAAEKIAIVTGGTRGIGRAISLTLAGQGAHVYAFYARNRKAADELTQQAAAKGLKITAIKCDLADADSFTVAIDQLKKEITVVDIIVHSAASGVHRPAMELTQKHLAWTYGINVFAIHNLIKELVPLMAAGGRIVGVTSGGGTRVIPYYAAVGSSKGALESLFRHYALELAPKGIAVNLVCPGMVLTDAVDAFPERDARIERSTGMTPTGRLTTPEDVAATVAFLTSPAAAQIIGQTIVIDGGKVLH